MCWQKAYARTGIICNVTPIENEFEGNIVIELSNTTPNRQKFIQTKELPNFYFLNQTVNLKQHINLKMESIKDKRLFRWQK